MIGSKRPSGKRAKARGGAGEGCVDDLRLRYLHSCQGPVQARPGGAHQAVLRKKVTMNDSNTKPGTTAGSKDDVKTILGTAKTIAAVKKK